MATEAKTILIVEDEELLRRALAEAFKSRGYIVFTAEDGESGLKLALSKKPDLILLDQLMPQMRGVEMLTKLRSDPWGNTVQVIIATNLTTAESLNEAIDAGANDYFIKSEVSMEDIVELVEERTRQ